MGLLIVNWRALLTIFLKLLCHRTSWHRSAQTVNLQTTRETVYTVFFVSNSCMASNIIMGLSMLMVVLNSGD